MKLRMSLLAAIIGLMYGCSQSPAGEKLNTIPAKEETEIESGDEKDNPGDPGERFWQVRAWPDAALDMRAYHAALDKAAEMAGNYKTLPKGFSRAWLLQGPTNIGGRMNAIAVDPGNSKIMYAGSAQGGLYKTTDGGANWLPIFEGHNYLGISCIVIDTKNHNNIFIGTGDPNISISPVVGDGIYKSTDAGKTWQHLGLGNERIISHILLHPDSAHIMYAASMGIPMARDNSRGLYKSTDSGRSWKSILFIDDETGIIDAVLDPKNPNTIYASSWTRIRTNRETLVLSKKNKIYKSTDGGNKWTVLSKGLPPASQTLSRIGLAISPKNPLKLYATIIDSNLDLEGVYKTTDGGKNWNKMPASGLPNPVMGNFGWYFNHPYINPYNDDDIYIGGVELWHFDPSAQSWSQANPNWWTYAVHSDKHDLQFLSPDSFVIATDGGVFKYNIPNDAWSRIDSISNTQFYHVAINPNDPTNFYGGAQDNGTMRGNYTDMNSWQRIYGGDGFKPVFHPTDPDISYYETQNGNVATYDANSFQWINCLASVTDRKPWDMAYIMSPHNPDILFAGTSRVQKNVVGQGCTWQPISPNLTDSVIYGGGFHCISSLDQSLLDSNIILAGTSDGNVWRTLDGGKNWDSLHAKLPNRYVTCVLASSTDKNTFFVSHTGYKYNEYIPHIHRSTDQGKNWTDISGDLPPVGINDIWVYPGRHDSAIFAATDAGVYGTINAGINWFRLGNNMGIYPVLDIEFDKFSNLLVAGTFARSLMTYPMDSALKLATPATYVNKSSKGPTLLASVFPNPVGELLNIRISGPMEGQKEVSLTLMDLNGKLLLKKSYIRSTEALSVPVSSLAPGTYILLIKEGDRSKTVKIMKTE